KAETPNVVHEAANLLNSMSGKDFRSLTNSGNDSSLSLNDLKIGDFKETGSAKDIQIPVKSPVELGGMFDEAMKTRDFGKLNSEMAKSAKEAYEVAGAQGVMALFSRTNDSCTTPGAAPIPELNGKELTIHNARQVPPEMAADIASMPEQERKEKGYFHTQEAGWCKDITPPVKYNLENGSKIEPSSDPRAGEAERKGEANTNGDGFIKDPSGRVEEFQYKDDAHSYKVGRDENGQVNKIMVPDGREYTKHGRFWTIQY